MRHRQSLDLSIEIGWVESAIDAAMLASQAGESDPSKAAQHATTTHAVLRLVAQRLRDLSREPGEDDPPATPRRRRR